MVPPPSCLWLITQEREKNVSGGTYKTYESPSNSGTWTMGLAFIVLPFIERPPNQGSERCPTPSAARHQVFLPARSPGPYALWLVVRWSYPAGTLRLQCGLDLLNQPIAQLLLCWSLVHAGYVPQQSGLCPRLFWDLCCARRGTGTFGFC